MVEVGVHHFKSLFLEPQGCPILDTLDTLNLFPWKISKEMNERLEEKVSESELLGALSIMQT